MCINPPPPAPSSITSAAAHTARSDQINQGRSNPNISPGVPQGISEAGTMVQGLETRGVKVPCSVQEHVHHLAQFM